MKKIGQLLRKLTLTDYLVFILVIASILYYFVYFKRGDNYVYIDVFSPSPEWSEDSYPINRWQTAALKVGDPEYNSFGQKTAEVTEVYRTPWNGGKQEYMFATLKLRANFNKNTRTYSFNGNPLLIGGEFVLNANNVALDSKIIRLYHSPEERSNGVITKHAIIQVMYKSQEPWLVDKLKTKTGLVDSSGRPMFTLSNLKISPAVEYYANWQGQVVTSIHPSKLDVVATIDIPNVECADYGCFYNHYFPLTVGWDFPLEFGDVLVTHGSSILDIQYKN